MRQEKETGTTSVLQHVRLVHMTLYGKTALV